MSFRDQKPPFDFSGREVFSSEDAERAVRILIRLILIVPVVLLVLWGVFSAVFTIDAEERGVVLRFGEYSHIADPGLHFKLPYGIDQVEIVPAVQRVLKEEFGFRTERAGQRTQYSNRDYPEESLMLTGDLNIIDVEWVIQYRIDDPVAYLFNIRDPKETLRDVTEAVMRRIVGNRLGSSVLTTERTAISLKAREEIQTIMSEYESGIQVNTIELQDVVPPARVQPAFNEVNVSRQERERMINEAEKRRNQQIPRMQGEALQKVAAAEGYAIERVNRAKGEVARFNAILSEYKAAPEVTRRRLYLEAISEVLPSAGRIVVVPEGGMEPLPLLNLDSRTNPLTGGEAK